MIPARFDYHRPADVASALALLGELGDEARVLAGGHSLIPMMKLRMAAVSHLIDLQDIADLRGIRIDGTRVTIGAMTTQHELIEHEASPRSRRSCAKPRSRSPTRRCATWAPSAATSRTATRATTCRA